MYGPVFLVGGSQRAYFLPSVGGKTCNLHDVILQRNHVAAGSPKYDSRYQYHSGEQQRTATRLPATATVVSQFAARHL